MGARLLQARGSGSDHRTRGSLRGEEGQSTVEYAVIAAGFLAVLVATGLAWHLIGDGVLLEHAVAAASHGIGVSAEGAVDVMCF